VRILRRGLLIKTLASESVPVIDAQHMHKNTSKISGVANHGALGHVHHTPTSFRNYVHSTSTASLTVKISKIVKKNLYYMFV